MIKNINYVTKCEFNIDDVIRIKGDITITFVEISRDKSYKVVGCFGDMICLDRAGTYYSRFFELDKQYYRELQLNKII